MPHIRLIIASTCITYGSIVVLLVLFAPGDTPRKAMAQHLPFEFKQNKGQAPKTVRFIANLPDYSVNLMEAGAELHFASKVVTVRLVGAREKSKPRGYVRLDEIIRHVGALRSSDENPTFASVRYESIYTGIDLVFYGRRGAFQYDFLVKALADPRQIRLAIDGVDRLQVDESGDLLVQVGEEILRMKRPHAFQIVEPETRSVDVRYEVQEPNEVMFGLGEYDPKLPLTIDQLPTYMAN